MANASDEDVLQIDLSEPSEDLDDGKSAFEFGLRWSIGVSHTDGSVDLTFFGPMATVSIDLTREEALLLAEAITAPNPAG